jgi:NAD(P)-dependent dehydrogenase (short-subunit alcohol dehydrogenase family)
MCDKMKNILITGGAGFIGSNLALNLINKNYNITVLDNLSPQVHGNNLERTSPLSLSIKDKVKFINGTVTSKDNLIESIKNQDTIVHLAAETGTGQSMYEIQKYSNVNIGATALLLDLLTNTVHKVKQVQEQLVMTVCPTIGFLLHIDIKMFMGRASPYPIHIPVFYPFFLLVSKTVMELIFSRMAKKKGILFI